MQEEEPMHSMIGRQEQQQGQEEEEEQEVLASNILPGLPAKQGPES